MEEIYELEEEVVDRMPVSRSAKEKLLIALDLIINIIIIVVLVVLVRKFLISPFQVFGPSMCKTLNYIDSECRRGFGEYLIVNKAVYQNFFGFRFSTPQRGDIIVFHPPHEKENFYIKRIIGLSGETVSIRNGKVFVSGEELPEPYIDPGNLTLAYQDSEFTVPEGHYFVLGDNRRESSDSRTCFGASPLACKNSEDHFLPMKNISGKAWVILWPISKIRMLRNPAY